MKTPAACGAVFRGALLVLLVGLVRERALGMERHVMGGSGGGAGASGSGILVYPNIQAAIDSAQSGDEIILAPYVFSGAGNRDLRLGGKAITVRGMDPNDPNVVAATVIDCGGSVTDPHRGFVFDANEGPNSVVAGLTVTNGYGAPMLVGAVTVSVGGAMLCVGARPTIRQCRFLDNLADDYGGAICVVSAPSFGETTVQWCLFESNEGGVGGAICCVSAGITVVGCTFRGNAALMDGGALYSVQCSPAVFASEFRDNACLGSGGAVYARNGVSLAACTIVGNIAGTGGAVYGMPSVSRCTIAGNRAGSCGGGLYIENDRSTVSPCTIDGSTISGNLSGMYGGGVYGRWYSQARLGSCTVGNNRAQGGGGMCFSSYGEPEVIHCTISGNDAGVAGGGVLADDTSIVKIANSILWADTSAMGPEVALTSRHEGQAARVEIRYSDVEGGPNDALRDPNAVLVWSDGNIDRDPLFVSPLGSSGDPNIWEDKDYHLRAGSPAIDAAEPGGNYSGQADIDNEPRLMGSRADMGSDEFPGGPYYHVLSLSIENETAEAVQIEPNGIANLPLHVYPAGTRICLTAVSHFSGRHLEYWWVFDPNYPGDVNHVVEDVNSVIYLDMNTDQEVIAHFRCGGYLFGVVPATVVLLSSAMVHRRLRRRSCR